MKRGIFFGMGCALILNCNVMAMHQSQTDELVTEDSLLKRITSIENDIKDHKLPKLVDDFWLGLLREQKGALRLSGAQASNALRLLKKARSLPGVQADEGDTFIQSESSYQGFTTQLKQSNNFLNTLTGLINNENCFAIINSTIKGIHYLLEVSRVIAFPSVPLTPEAIYPSKEAMGKIGDFIRGVIKNNDIENIQKLCVGIYYLHNAGIRVFRILTSDLFYSENDMRIRDIIVDALTARIKANKKQQKAEQQASDDTDVVMKD